jgi:hypothetical protein
METAGKSLSKGSCVRISTFTYQQWIARAIQLQIDLKDYYEPSSTPSEAPSPPMCSKLKEGKEKEWIEMNTKLDYPGRQFTVEVKHQGMMRAWVTLTNEPTKSE